MSLADSAGALVTFLGLPEGKTTATITSTSHMFRPVTGGTVRAVAMPVHRGRTTVTTQTSVYDAAEKLVAQTVQVRRSGSGVPKMSDSSHLDQASLAEAAGQQLGQVGAADPGELVELGAAGEPVG